VIHISEAEAASDFASLMARVRSDAEVVIEDNARPVAVVPPSEPYVVGVTGDQEAALSAIGLTELIHGLYRAKTSAVRFRRQSLLDELLRDLTVYPSVCRS